MPQNLPVVVHGVVRVVVVGGELVVGVFGVVVHSVVVVVVELVVVVHSVVDGVLDVVEVVLEDVGRGSGPKIRITRNAQLVSYHYILAAFK